MSCKTNKMKPILFLIVILCLVYSHQAGNAEEAEKKEGERTEATTTGGTSRLTNHMALLVFSLRSLRLIQ
ncbi:hypothetical protein D915_008604 [Fasciola hepatica]|uniref:Uncharacterized protein n=1 Tax=Fasciola hepatica TaxID=6192 RepID=A0A4E0R0G1_FASHE|nr:hypothetical protein D915_008604 [Fasciola hepatica]